MTKREFLAIMLALALALALFAACDRGGGTSGPSTDGETPASSPAASLSPATAPSPTPTPEQPADPSPEQPFEGKIAIVTYDVSGNEEWYRSAEALQKEYGEDKIIHKVWPVCFSTESEKMITLLQTIAEDPDVRAVILNEAVINTNYAVDALLEARPDIFIAYCEPVEDPPEVASRANLSLAANDQLRGETIVMQAKAMGAKVFAHYSFPRHMAVPILSQRRGTMMAACEREGLTFVDLTAPDPTDNEGIPGAQQFILDDVPRQVAQWGKDTAFFSTNCAMQIPLIIKIISEGAIYPEPCCPSPGHGFPPALGIDSKIFDGSNVGLNEDWKPVDFGRTRTAGELVVDIRSEVADRGATGRLATWPVPTSRMFSAVATEYAIKWINGDVPQEKGNIDYAAIEELCEAYIFEETGERLGVEINPLVIRGRAYNSYLLFVLDSIVF